MKNIVRFGVAVAIGLACAGATQAQVQDPSAPLVAKARTVVDLMAAQEFAGAIEQFDAVMKRAMPEDKLRAAWAALIQQVGAFKQRGNVTAQPRGLLTITRVRCQFEKRDLDVQVVFDGDGLVGGLAFLTPTPDWAPPPYATAGTYTETDITVGTDRWPLSGSLTMPPGAGPFPALVLVHGSGPEDRDESFGPNKPFKDLAVGLASRGIAVLRFEKRTQQYAGKLGVIAGFTVMDESVDDALAAVAKLRLDSRIDPKRLFVLGHSLGGTLVSRIAAADPAIAGVISLAGATRKIQEAMLAQVNYLVDASGPVTPDGQKQIDDATKLVAAIRALKPSDASDPKSIGGAPASYWLDLEAYDPVAVAATLKTPMLILQGERDYQVTFAEDFARWKTGLASRANVTFKSYPALNHLFLAGSGKSPPAEYNVPGHVAEDVIVDIAQWIRR